MNSVIRTISKVLYNLIILYVKVVLIGVLLWILYEILYEIYVIKILYVYFMWGMIDWLY